MGSYHFGIVIICFVKLYIEYLREMVMKYICSLVNNKSCIVVALFAVILIQGCAIQLVPDYKANVAQEIINVSKKVDIFYGKLIETSDSERNYANFKDKYIRIEADLRALIVQNKARPLNDESISIAETTLNKWLKYKKKHKENDSYKVTLAKNHRKRFTRLFTAMSIAEEAKKMRAEQTKENGGDE